MWATNPIKLSLDQADGWPRYYFDLDRAQAEIADWLKVRGQQVTKSWTDHITERDWRHELLDSV